MKIYNILIFISILGFFSIICSEALSQENTGRLTGTPRIGDVSEKTIFYYDSAPFSVENYKIDEVITKAIILDYSVTFSQSCKDLDLHACNSRGFMYENTLSQSSNKFLNVVSSIFNGENNGNQITNKTYISILIKETNYENRLSLNDRFNNPNEWSSIVSSNNENIDISQIETKLRNEFEKLGISVLNEIEYNKRESGQEKLHKNGINNNTSSPIFNIFFISLIIFTFLISLLIVIIIKTKKLKK